MFFDVPVIGSRHNVPVNSDETLYVDDTDYMTDSYLVRKDDAASKYVDKIKEILKTESSKYNCRDFIKKHTSFSAYCDRVDNLLIF
jgi:hypothetical protein